MNARICYWTVVDGEYAEMAKAVLKSARQVGVEEDFHIWTDRPIPGAVCHPAGEFIKWGCIFKLTFLRDAVQKLDYDYFIWFDADTWFVRHPGNVLRVLDKGPMHITLECDVCSPLNQRLEWWDCPNEKFAELMRAQGLQSKSIYNVNGGFFIVHRDAVNEVVKRCFDFYYFCKAQGYVFVDEPLLAYAMQMLCRHPEQHTFRATCDLWGSDWTGNFADRLPDGQPWIFTDYFTGEELSINPAIVHAMRSKQALIKAAAT